MGGGNKGQARSSAILDKTPIWCIFKRLKRFPSTASGWPKAGMMLCAFAVQRKSYFIKENGPFALTLLRIEEI